MGAQDHVKSNMPTTAVCFAPSFHNTNQTAFPRLFWNLPALTAGEGLVMLAISVIEVEGDLGVPIDSSSPGKPQPQLLRWWDNHGHNKGYV
jgi:hypothetical protein